MPRKKISIPLPEPGTVFLMPLPNGLYSTCRVLRRSTPEELKRQGIPMALVAGAAWVGTDVPDLRDPRLRQILVLTHHAFRDSPAVLWLEGAPPEEYRIVGNLPPTEEEMQIEAGSSAWSWFAYQAYAQWRWEHEREAVLQEDAAKEAIWAAAQADGAAQHRRYLDGLTLKGLRKRRWFAGWRSYVKAALVKECRAIFVETIDALIALGPKPGVRPRIRILRSCIYRLNTLDEQNDHFIATVEREDLCEGFQEIVYACGLHDCPDLAERWRDW